jgi:Fe-S cluster assembly scaffold protein SufB
MGLHESRVKARAEIIGRAPEARGHIECLGLLVSGKASIAAYPHIVSENPGSTLSHEAAIGKISREELEYLMSRGFTEDEAKSIIVRGFMRVDAPGLPEVVRRHVDNIVSTISKLAIG